MKTQSKRRIMILIASKNILNDSTNMGEKSSPAQLACRQIFYIFFMTLAVAAAAHAELTPLENRDMEEVCGTAGIMFAVKNIQIFHHIESIRYCAPFDNGYIEFQDFIMGGSGDVARFNYDFGSVTKSGIMLFDVAEPEVAPVNRWTGYAFGTTIHRGMTLLRVPDWDQELSFSIDNILFYDPNYIVPPATSAAPVDLGSFYIGLIDMPRFYTYTSPPVDGSGFDFQHNFQMTIDNIGYYFNQNSDSLELGPTYIGGDFTDLGGDDPRFPNTWKPNQATPVDFGEFQIGDLFGDISNGIYSNPAGFDVGESDIDCNGTVLGYMNLRLPMEGSIRFESALWHTDRTTNTFTDFGPGAIDGLKVHRLDMLLIP
jgi:hypothetical protein